MTRAGFSCTPDDTFTRKVPANAQNDACEHFGVSARMRALEAAWIGSHGVGRR
jgi:hypothetical protein